MDRRTVLAGAGTWLAALAGCASASTGGEPTDSPTDSATPTATPTDSATPTATATDSPTPAPPRIAEQSLEPRENCDEAGAATIAVDGDAVVVEGCIVGENGCQRPVLDSATYDAERDELRVRVTTEAPSDAEACTQQLVDLPYRVTVTFANDLPGTTTVVHDGVHGEQQVAQSETGGN